MSDGRTSPRADRTEKELASEKNAEASGRLPTNSLGTASRRKARSKATTMVQQGGGGPRQIAPLLVVSAFVATAALIWQHFRRKRPSRGAASLMEEGLQLPTPVSGPGPRSLRGLRVVCSASFDLAHIGRHEGSVAHSEGREEAALLDRLLDAGAELVGRSNSEELHLGLLGEGVQGSSPAAPQCIMSGTSCGVALLVANGMADIGLGLDHLAGIRVQAAMNGICSFRPSQNVGSLRGVSRVTESLDAVGWAVQDPALLPRVAEALKISGGAQFSKTDLFRLVIGSEVFEKLGEEGKVMERIALKVSKKWAGPDYVASGSLISFLKTAVPSAQHFLGYDNDSEDVLEGIRRAAVTLQHWDLLHLHGHLLENPDELLPSILEQLTRAQDIGEEEVQAAEAVARETREAMRSILKGSMLILPSLPCRQHLRGSEKDKLKQWERGALQLAALSTFSGCPQANIPIHRVKDAPPLGLGILSLIKTDQQLANVASALAPLVDACARDIFSPPGTPRQQEQVSAGGKRGWRRKEQPSAEALAEEQELKEAGNASFKAGKFEEAVAHYTLALRANATNAVLYSNRAQAFIKLGRFEEAEEDCNKGLKLHLNAKTLLRRGTARAAQGNTDGALQDFKQVLAVEPANRQAKVELSNLQEFTGLDRGLMV